MYQEPTSRIELVERYRNVRRKLWGPPPVNVVKKKREEKWRLIYNQPIGPMAQPVQSCKLQFDIMRRILDCVSKVCGISV